ncbi:MAG: peptidase M55 [Lentisphaerae bacterium]|nr:peptidase M55 [Lentisphaerota bacterium]
MKIFMMTDMEGVAGILNHDDWVLPTGRFYDKGMRLLTAEINAAVAGFAAAGASEIIVVDGHGAGGIDPELLDGRAQLSRGRHPEIWPWGLDKTFDAVAFVGQHAKAGTPFSQITHTGWFNTIDMRLNNISIGEYGQMALCAMELGVPTIFASGEQALCREAEDLTPGVVTVAVKRGLLPDGLDHLDGEAYAKAKLSAIHLAPVTARRQIEVGAKAALDLLKKNPEVFTYPKITPPYTLSQRFRAKGAHPPFEVVAHHPDSIAKLFTTPGTII